MVDQLGNGQVLQQVEQALAQPADMVGLPGVNVATMALALMGNAQAQAKIQQASNETLRPSVMVLANQLQGQGGPLQNLDLGSLGNGDLLGNLDLGLGQAG